MPKLTKYSFWKKLQDHYNIMANVTMRDMFKSDQKRFNTFSLQFNDILVDYSKNSGRMSIREIPGYLVGVVH